ncbi:MAG: translation initiation factor [Chloroflexi bacterium]|nr:translation initiation factor [Chloroflexota bacterium]
MRSRKRNVVYSTDSNFNRKQVKQRGKKTAVKSLPATEQTAHLHREKKGRGGKTVTVIRNLQLSPADMKALGKQLKKAAGTGGTIKDGAIEIQGDCRDKIAVTLQKLDYKTKNVGG